VSKLLDGLPAHRCREIAIAPEATPEKLDRALFAFLVVKVLLGE
jgi:hypothetical protein